MDSNENNIKNPMTRKDFLKKTAIGAASMALLGKIGFETVNAATVTDNLDSKGVHIGASAPANINMAWVDTSDHGVMKYWTGTAWLPICPTWHS